MSEKDGFTLTTCNDKTLERGSKRARGAEINTVIMVVELDDMIQYFLLPMV
jgi:hypothetical protein